MSGTDYFDGFGPTPNRVPPEMRGVLNARDCTALESIEDEEDFVASMVGLWYRRRYPRVFCCLKVVASELLAEDRKGPVGIDEIAGKTHRLFGVGVTHHKGFMADWLRQVLPPELAKNLAKRRAGENLLFTVKGWEDEPLPEDPATNAGES